MPSVLVLERWLRPQCLGTCVPSAAVQNDLDGKMALIGDRGWVTPCW